MRAERKGPGIYCLRVCENLHISFGKLPGTSRLANALRGTTEAPLATSLNTPNVSSFDDALSYYSLNELKLSHVTLKEEQRRVIELVYNGKDVFQGRI